ncbi:hypothetical protein DFP72DRAFT_871805 [Ephemerocybe angulata]|uniref:Uncharacterized protein n=1 Tax=Ephemerocybe angulata TaxID=980116 RepID=A0A8H6IF25_9AGAR|nr:hypothetical protein DFP72DRAFT_871805 [Tulosesus angulatus]
MPGNDTSTRASLHSLLKASFTLCFTTFGMTLAPLRQWTSRYLAPPTCLITLAFDITLLLLSYRQKAHEPKERSYRDNNRGMELEAAEDLLPKSAKPTRPFFLSLSPTYRSITIWTLSLLIVVWLTVLLFSASLIILGDENGVAYDPEDVRMRLFWYMEMASMALHAIILYSFGFLWAMEVRRSARPIAAVAQTEIGAVERSIVRLTWTSVLLCAAALAIGTVSIVLQPSDWT